MRKSAFIQKFRQRISARTQMTFILLATVASGIVASKLMLAFELFEPALRYGLAVLVSWVSFFMFVYLWLRSEFGSRRQSESSDALDFLDVWSGDPTFSHRSSLQSSHNTDFPDSGSVFDMDGDIDAEGAFVLLTLIVVAILCSSFILIYLAPEILLEVAFEFILAVGLAARTPKLRAIGWKSVLFEKTWWAFALVFLMAVGFGTYIVYKCPGVKSYSAFKVTCGNS